MTSYTYNFGAGDIQVLLLDGQLCRLNGNRISSMECLEFMQDANLKGVFPDTKASTTAKNPAVVMEYHNYNIIGVLSRGDVIFGLAKKPDMPVSFTLASAGDAMKEADRLSLSKLSA